ncbi:hypothetical protein [Roseomonas chloroacetimidivorans]|uniref:hypothetical protein n=1 Tax=Roseomonas chloroacetimidivorans TaxID=1766656 RepID=UPI003C784A1C
MPHDLSTLHHSIPGAHPGHVAHHSDYRAEEIGTVVLRPAAPVEAGAYVSLEIEFTAGRFGIDDTGSLRICSRIISDLGRPQFTDPAAPNYVTATASNGAVLRLSFDPKLAMRPWSRTLTVAVERGFLSPGETITIRFGDRSGGSPGLRMQTYCEEAFRLLVMADVFATSNWALLPDQPALRVIPGAPASWKAIVPTLRRPGEPFALLLRADDIWGNPTDRVSGSFRLSASVPVSGLPDRITWPEGARAVRIDDLRAEATEGLTIAWQAEDGAPICASNPIRLTPAARLPFWADLHGQSGETVGTNPIRHYAAYARDLAGVDVICHQGNDFQITDSVWADFNTATAGIDEPGRFVFFPGYEWSGNTALGGDRNVLYPEEGRPIRRSSRALIEDTALPETDALDARALHAALRADGRPTLLFPHVGGRYANLHFAHDRMLERAVEVHSDWGTFDWLLEDAFAVGARVGVVANSDGHKGRQGASHPGASQFGSYGGLTCILAEELTRASVFEALHRRRHYATTAAARVLVDVSATLATPAALYIDDPALGGAPDGSTAVAGMGDILAGVRDEAADFAAEVAAASPVERIEIRNRTELLDVWRPYAEADLGRRIRVVWEGSEYRGRGRETFWNGSVSLAENSWSGVAPINRWNVDKPFEADAGSVRFGSVTTGGFAGFEAVLDDPRAGTLRIDTGLVKAELDVSRIGFEDIVLEGGGLGRRVRVYRLPDINPHKTARLQRRVALRQVEDNALYIRTTMEDGSVAWSSPIYLIR